MKALELHNISKPYFGYEEIARILGINLASARVSASRYVQQGVLLRVKKNLYVLREAWDRAGIEEKFKIANLGQSPSYISLTTALSFYEVTTQLQQAYFESVATKRTREIEVGTAVFRYTKIKEALFFGFQKVRGFFIAFPEKALLDAFYLMSYGRYALDMAALDMAKIDGEVLRRMSTCFPPKTAETMKKYECFPTT